MWNLNQTLTSTSFSTCTGNFKDIPTDIVLDILTRLPTESVLDCKLVCKPWRNLVSRHPSFRQLHLTRLNQTHLNQYSADSGMLSFLSRDEYGNLYYLEYIEKHEKSPIDCIRRFNLTVPVTTSYIYDVLGSINGLVCLYQCQYGPYYICNPVTKEFVMLPKFNRVSKYDGSYRSSGFGFLSSTNEYKVVELYQRQLGFMEIVVYTLGSGQGWRHVGRFDTEIANISTDHGVFVSGALHWRDKIDGTVWVFDLTEEKFGKHLVPLPSLLSQNNRNYSSRLEVSGGVLYYAINYYFPTDAGFDIWLLKEKRDLKEQVEHELLGWKKEFSLLGGKPLALTKSGGVLCFGLDSLYIYDPAASALTKLVKFGKRSTIIPHKNTLVSLKELGEKDIKMMESASRSFWIH